MHYLGWVDPQKLWLANLNVGYVGSPFYGVFGSSTAVLSMPRHTARVLAFPGCPRGELARLRAELAEMRRSICVRGGC